MSMNCDGCEYDGFVMWGDKKVSYCRYFRQTKHNMDRINYPPYYPFQHGYCLQKPERPKGEWVEYIDEMSGARYGRCTQCNKSTLNAVSYDLDGQRYIMDFCPKCGADCRGEE